MNNFLSSSANAPLNHDCMSSNLTEWLLQEKVVFSYSVAITSQKGHNPHDTRADATLSTLKSDFFFPSPNSKDSGSQWVPSFSSNQDQLISSMPLLWYILSDCVSDLHSVYRTDAAVYRCFIIILMWCNRSHLILMIVVCMSYWKYVEWLHVEL